MRKSHQAPVLPQGAVAAGMCLGALARQPGLSLLMSASVLFGCTGPGADPMQSSVGSVGGIHYEAAGVGPAVVLIHGGGLDSRMWEDQVKVLAPNFHVIRYDVRGYGQSEPVPQPIDHIRDLATLLDTLDVATASIVGLSLGGAIALNFALIHPERTERLLLAAPAVPGASAVPQDLQRFQRIGRLLQEGRSREAVDEWLSSGHMAAAMSNTEISAQIRAMAQENHRAWLSSTTGSTANTPTTAQRLGEVRARTAVIVGSLDDSSVVALAELVESSVPDAVLDVLPGVGHILNLEAPSAFNRWLLAGLDAAQEP